MPWPRQLHVEGTTFTSVRMSAHTMRVCRNCAPLAQELCSGCVGKASADTTVLLFSSQLHQITSRQDDQEVPSRVFSTLGLCS